MDSVTVVFGNGSVVQFYAQEFDVNLASDYQTVNRYPYKDAQGHDSAIFLRPNAIAGIVLSKAATGGDPAVAYKVSGS
jgi:hypothetical protein